jgi:Ca-activated chloride channel family protein
MRPSPVLRADVRLVLVPVAVTDRRGATLNGLTAADFTVLHDAALQHIVSLTEQDAPCTVGIVLDVSGSMRNFVHLAKDAIRSFLAASNPQDGILLFDSLV